MFSPPTLPKTLAYFGRIGDVAELHRGEDFSTRLEDEINVHQGQIQAENLLLNTIAKFQCITDMHNIPREAFNQILRESKYSLDDAKRALMSRFCIPESIFEQSFEFEPIDTADYMRQRAAMLGAILSSTPVLLRDPWDGRPTTVQYGFTDFKAEIDGIGFSAIATPRYKGIPFRFAVLKHEHDGYIDNNPAMIMSNEFCDAFETYNRDKFGNLRADLHPLIIALATNLKPNIHDRFHNWLLYDTNAASDIFKQWGDDIYFVEHADKNPLLINYEQVALCFHLYGYLTLFEKNPELKGHMFQRLEHCITEIEKFGTYLKDVDYPKADAIAESTIYAVLSNICFVLNPFSSEFQNILQRYPDVKTKLLEVREDGKGIGATLERLHGYEHGVPSLRYGGATEAAIEYILRYPLVDEIRARLHAERSAGMPDEWQSVEGNNNSILKLKYLDALPPSLKLQLRQLPDQRVQSMLDDVLQSLSGAMRDDVVKRIHISDEGYFFFRLGREELDYTQFETRSQQKKVLLVDIAAGCEVRFTNEKRLSIKDRLKKQDFCLVGGKDILAINVRDEITAKAILAFGTNAQFVDPDRIIEKARELAAMTGEKSIGDMYKIERDIAASKLLYGFQKSGFYQTKLQKRVARAPGPIIMKLRSGGDQRLVKGAFVYLPLGRDPASDSDPDCHLIENTDYKRDYEAPDGTDALKAMRLNPNCPLVQGSNAQEMLKIFLQTLHTINFQITHGASSGARLSLGGKGLFT